MKKCINQLTKWRVVLLIVITLVQAIILPANAVTIEPGNSVKGPPICPQIEVSASDDSEDNIGFYSITLMDTAQPITDKNFVPSNSQLDSYYPPSGRQVVVRNLGKIAIEVSFVCD